ncbi:MAG TPA: hypothetical protein VFC82_12020 [Actinomycetaceae bacterium]|nr:hypothetical protein [Actinomycetaceae bacterium]
MSVTSYAKDLPFQILRWVAVAALAGLAYVGAMDALTASWVPLAVDVMLVLLVITVILRPSFALARAGVTADDDGIRRTGSWDLRWSEIERAGVEMHKDLQYAVVVPKRPAPGKHMTRFFIRGSGFPHEAVCAPLETHKAPEIRDVIRRHLG